MAATDATAQAAKLRAAQPDAIFVIGTTATPFRAIRQLQMKQPIVAVNGASSYEALNAMGSTVANDIVYPEFIVNEDPLPNQKEFVELFRGDERPGQELRGGRLGRRAYRHARARQGRTGRRRREAVRSNA
jgi:ABC-type branched-subunit amino acid transport system substrate-binding protein